MAFRLVQQKSQIRLTFFVSRPQFHMQLRLRVAIAWSIRNAVAVTQLLVVVG
jgi:hypothetical protein